MGIPLKLLLIEDSQSDADLIVLKLKKGGYDVNFERIENGPQMWGALQRQYWDVIISDHNLPQFDSLKALQILKDSGLDIPFIIVSGAIGEEIAIRAMKSGAQDYVPKNNLTRLPAAVEREIADAKGRKAQKHAEEALHESEERFHSLYENSTIGIYRTTPDGRILLANPALLEMLGYSSFDELASKNLEEALFEPSYPRGQFLELIEKSGEIKGLESSWKRKDGSLISVRESARAIRDIQGKTLYYDGTVEDITEHKQAEEKLIASETRYRRLFEAAKDGILILNADTGSIIDVNPFLIELLGLPREEFLGKTLWELGFLGDTVVSRGNFLELQKKGYVRYEDLPLKTADGRSAYVEFVSNVYAVDHTKIIQCNIRDITERKSIELQLIQSHKKYQALVETTSDFIWEMDANGVYTYCSPQMEILWGIKPGEMIGKSPFDLLPPEDKEQAIKGFSMLLQSSSAFKNLELRSFDGNGQIKFLEINGVPFFDSEGKQAGYRGITRDITERKKAEEALKESEEKFRLAFMTSLDAFYLATLEEGWIIEINDIFEDVFGYTREEIIGKTSLQLGLYHNPTDRAKMVSELSAKGRVKDLELQAKKKGGEIITISLSVGMMLLNDKRYILGVIRDITELKQAEDALKQSQKQYRILVENANEAIVVAQEGRLKFVNPTTFELFPGYTAQELTTRLFTDFVHPDDRARIVENFQKRLKGEPMSPRNQYRLIMRDGGVRWAEIGTALITWEGQPATLNFISDITEGKKTEDALKESEEKYRLITQNMSEMVILLDFENKPTFISPSFQRIRGFTLEEIRTLQPEKNMKPASWDLFLKTRADELTPERLADKKCQISFKLDSDLYRKDGSSFWVEDTYNLIRKEDGTPSALMVVSRDITERKKAEDALKHSQEQYHILVENANEAIVVAQEGRLKFVNPTTFELFPGYTAQELTTPLFTDFVHPDDRARMVENLQKRLKGEPMSPINQYRLIMRDGSVRWAEISTALITWEGQPATLNFISDITERKHVEEALLESEEKFRNLADQSPNIIFIHSGKKIVYVNNKAVQMMGYSREELYSPEFNFLSLIAPEFQEQLKSAFSEHLKGKDTPAIEYVVITKEGKRIEVILSTKLIDYGGKQAILGTITDTSESKKAEVERRHLEEKAQVTSRLAAVGEMAAGIAHEINNPLTSVIGFSELLMEQDLPQEVMEEIKIIAEGSRRVADIVKRLLTFARQNKPVKTALDINSLIDNTLKLRTYVLQTAGISVYTCYDQSLPWITADPGQLQQVVLNLIVNAEQAMKSAHNGGELKIITEKHDQRIRIVFEDNGTGITKENLARLFEPFFTTKGPGEGTGLGLSLSRSIVLEHGGEIWAESEPGHGATFIVELPLSEAPAPPTDAEILRSTESAKHTPSARILVVDDESSVRDYLQVALTAAGHTVACSGDPEEALKAISDNSYDIIFLDIRMPGMSGTELYGRIMQKVPSLVRRVVFMTGDAADAGIKAFLTHNNLPFLAKPFERKSLLDKVRSCLEAD